jgi:hypothetical protein
VGDVNGDGKLDVVAGGQMDNFGAPGTPLHSLAVMLGDGDGTLQAATSLSNGMSSNSQEATFDIKLADLNGDGKLDIIGATQRDNFNYNQAGSVFTMLGNGNGTFQPAVSWSNGSNHNGFETTTGLSVGDINADGFLDIAALDSGGSVGVLYGHGDGTFQSAVVVPTGPHTGLDVALGYLVSA